MLGTVCSSIRACLRGIPYLLPRAHSDKFDKRKGSNWCPHIFIFEVQWFSIRSCVQSLGAENLRNHFLKEKGTKITIFLCSHLLVLSGLFGIVYLGVPHPRPAPPPSKKSDFLGQALGTVENLPTAWRRRVASTKVSSRSYPWRCSNLNKGPSAPPATGPCIVFCFRKSPCRVCLLLHRWSYSPCISRELLSFGRTINVVLFFSRLHRIFPAAGREKKTKNKNT